MTVEENEQEETIQLSPVVFMMTNGDEVVGVGSIQTEGCLLVKDPYRLVFTEIGGKMTMLLRPYMRFSHDTFIEINMANINAIATPTKMVLESWQKACYQMEEAIRKIDEDVSDDDETPPDHVTTATTSSKVISFPGSADKKKLH